MNFGFINNPALPPRVNEFATYIISIRGGSENTVISYASDLQLFFKFLKAYKNLVPHDMPFEEIPINDIGDDFLGSIDINDMYAFITYSEKYRKNKKSSRARKIACLKSFFRYLNKKIKIIDSNPADELETPRAAKRNPIYLTEKESRQLLKSVSGRNVERDRCIITFFLNCGLRLSELCSLNLSKLKGDTISVVGKGNKERTVYLNKACMKALNEYLPIRMAKDKEVPTEHKDALFLSEQKKRIYKRTVEKLVDKYVTKAGYGGKHYSPHKLRHTAATLLYKNGVDVLRLKELLGHENVSTTQIYTHVESEQLRDAVSLNPLNLDED